MTSRRLQRKANLEKRNARIREAFKKRYTDQERPKKYTREYIIAQIADEFCLSMDTVEDIIYKKPDAAAAPAASETAQAA